MLYHLNMLALKLSHSNLVLIHIPDNLVEFLEIYFQNLDCSGYIFSYASRWAEF